MESVSVSRFKATCLELMRKVKATGQPLLITRNGEPVAQLIPPPATPATPDWIGSGVGTGRILGDVVSPLEVEWEAQF